MKKERNLTKIENMIKQARLTDAQTVKVDKQFKADLKEKLYEAHLNNISSNRIMKGSSKGDAKKNSSNSRTLLKTGLMWFGGLSILATAVYFIGMQFIPQTENSAPTLATSVAFVEGDVEYKTSEHTWMDLTEGDVLAEGTNVKTGEKSKAILQIDNGSVVRLNENSEIQLENMNPHTIVIAQINGESYNRVMPSETSTHTVVSGQTSAKALGTAYLYRKVDDGAEVLVYESKVLFKNGAEVKELSALNKGVANKEEQVEVKEMTEEEYKAEFATWNQEKDSEKGFEGSDKTAPTVEITSPKSGSTVESNSVTVSGKLTDESKLKKVIVAGTIYTSMKDGNGFNPATGEFKVKVSLKEGKNSIKVTGYDIYWNQSSKSVDVTYSKPVVEEPTPTKYFYISSISSPAVGKVSLGWYMSGYTAPHGFKVVWSNSQNPTYPGSSYKYYSNSGSRSASFAINPGTYYFRVCIYNGNGACTYYTPNKSVTVNGSSESDYATGITLTKIGSPTLAMNDFVVAGYTPLVHTGNYKQKFTWSISGGGAPKGYKLVWNETGSPVYPGSSYNYYSSESTTYGYADGLESGKTYYVRACIYLGGACGAYSNQISVTIP